LVGPHGWPRRQRPHPLLPGPFAMAHRRDPIGQDDGTAEVTGGVGRGVLQDCSIAQVDMPVVRPEQGDAIGHGGMIPECFDAAMLPESASLYTPWRSIEFARISPGGLLRECLAL